ncbi:type II secretion system protein [Evansella sp. AB-P1]|uniref:type II secretion system protein n=1 Tax=Evansella sp. AB-P1 TaxID=3037653 RepID=UPI00241DD10F|nr:type II secretion system protein [Evansella sp. AB-P1]MDG5788723.1 type II secretion system protein [Evansella sp. AB-P1]
MQNDKGFTFIEVILSLLLFSVTVAVIVPAFVIVQQERQAIRSERDGEQLILHLYHENNDLDELDGTFVHLRSTTFYIKASNNNMMDILCVSWQGGNGREYDRCLSNKKR